MMHCMVYLYGVFVRRWRQGCRFSRGCLFSEFFKGCQLHGPAVHTPRMSASQFCCAHAVDVSFTILLRTRRGCQLHNPTAHTPWMSASQSCCAHDVDVSFTPLLRTRRGCQLHSLAAHTPCDESYKATNFQIHYNDVTVA